MQASPASIVVEKDQSGRPHNGKVFVAVHAHLRDLPYYAGGLCAKLISEGYTGYVVRTTNDEKSGGRTLAQNILSNEQEHLKMAAALGFKDVFDLYYRSHRMTEISPVEFHGRLVLILRMVKADTVISFGPSGGAEDDADHAVTGRAVEEACSMAGSDSDFQEHFEGSIQPHVVRERYWFYARPEQPFNRVVDIGSHLEKKIDAIAECKSQGGGALGSELRARLAKQGRRLALLGNDDRAADRAYIREFLLDDFREYGRQSSVPFAERFYYSDQRAPAASRVDEYVEKNAVRI